MDYVCRNCLTKARNMVSRAHRSPRRTFTVSQDRRANTLPKLPPTSNAELDNVLATLRDKQFVPYSLNKQQRKLVFDPKAKNELDATPIMVRTGDEEVAVRHLQRFKDVPARRPLLLKALGLMQDKTDIELLPTIFKTLVTVKARDDVVLMQKSIKHATKLGRFDVILRCLALPAPTGFSFKYDGILQQTLKSLHDVAEQDDWAEASLAKATRYADAIAVMLDQQGHARGATPSALVDNDPRVNPEVIGLFLELAAVNVYKHGDKKDANGSVEKYAKRVAACLEIYKVPEQTSSDKLYELHSQFYQLFSLWHGLSVAKPVLDAPLLNTTGVRDVLAVCQQRLESIVAKSKQHECATDSFGDQITKTWAARVIT